MSRPPVSPLIRYEAMIDRSTDPDGCHLWTGGVDRHGYGRMRVEGGSSVSTRDHIHRWAYIRLVGPVSPNEVIRHSCDNPPCQNQRHWIKGTQIDNMRDAVERGRTSRGEHRPNSKLAEWQVLEIIRTKDPPRMMAQKYGVSRHTISDIRAGRRWGWLCEKYPELAS